MEERRVESRNIGGEGDKERRECRFRKLYMKEEMIAKSSGG